jgi:DNA-binding response OmpR family regulator
MAKKTILIAEDDPQLSELYGLRFEYEGFSAFHALDGEEALQYIKEYKPSLVLLDIMMPKKSGLEVLKEIRQDRGLKNIKVVVLSALFSKKNMEEAKTLGVSGYYIKGSSSIGEVVDEILKIVG